MYAIEKNSGAMTCIPSFMKIGSDIEKLMLGEGDSPTYRQLSELISLFLFFRRKESR
jgi:hypothetical protein